MDYIENYKKAHKNKFQSSEDKESRRNFWQKSKKDIEWGKSVGLIKDMSFDDYIKANCNKTKRVVTDEERAVINHELNFPSWILAQYYDLHPSTIAHIRRQSKLESQHCTK